MSKDVEQTPNGVKLQGNLLMGLALAMIIAGATAAYMQWQESGNVNPFQQSEVQNEDPEDTTEPAVAPTPEPDTASSGGDSTPAVLADEDKAVQATAVPEEAYCKIVMVGHGNDFSEVSTPHNTAWLSAELCAGVILGLTYNQTIGLIPDDEFRLPEVLE